MGFDYTSLLMASGAAGVALCFTLATSWARQRESTFLLIWAICMAILIAAIATFSLFHAGGESAYGIAAGVLMTTAYAISYGGLTQFREGRFDGRSVMILAVIGAAPIMVTGALGLDGLSFIFINLMSAALLGFCGFCYWNARSESPGPITAIVALHVMLMVSFLLCGIAIAFETPLYLHGKAPDNWAENLNLVVSVIAITGIGGLFVTIHQERIARRHRDASLIDPLTGLGNRRALFERFADGAVREGTGLIVFDLDDFKQLNDRFGHSFGDTVLTRFAQVLAENSRPGGLATRLGGEEFVLVVMDSSAMQAMALAERIRRVLGNIRHICGEEAVTCTVSAGVAVAEKPDVSLDTLIRKADNALYLSKRSGRNRVSQIASSAA